MRKIFLPILSATLCGGILGVGVFTGEASAQTGIVIANPEECNFDKDSLPDTWTTNRKKGIATLTSNNRTKRVTMKRAWTHFTCVDRQPRGGDGISEIVGRMSADGKRKQVISVSSSGSGKLNSVCKSISELRSCQIWKSQQSEHISRGDPRHRSTGFITTRGCPDEFPNPMFAYDSKGNLIHRLGEYFPSGSFYDSRHYGCFAAGDCKSPVSIAIEARQRTGKEDIYLKANSGTCYRVPDPGQCYNSSGC